MDPLHENSGLGQQWQGAKRSETVSKTDLSKTLPAAAKTIWVEDRQMNVFKTPWRSGNINFNLLDGVRALVICSRRD
jgi:hypothetical protein